jgi:flagellar hook assembly protein FlgD
MRLRGVFSDPENRTAPQLDNWYLLHADLPDAAIDPYVNFSFHADTVLQGETVRITLNARNLSQLDMDSLLVQFQVRNQNGTLTTVGTWRGPRLPAGLATYPIEFSFPTFDFPGHNTLIITINPNNDQPEKYFFNNVFNQAFFVKRDVINPILDVTFDGRHIMDGDIVAPTPRIVVQLNDENPYYLISDPAAFEVYFKRDNLDDGDKGELVEMSSGLVTFEPATSAENKARLIFSPQRLEDGDYVLTVNGQDVNGNLAGRVRYRVKFRVMNESTITDVINYPNPFSTCTKFVYTLTGDVMPEVFQIQIFTVTGKLVRTIDLKAEGEVFVGQHITQYCWDGTDEFGDRLANGVYLYRVNFKLPGNAFIRKNNEATSQYFEKGWGKMYIMR